MKLQILVSYLIRTSFSCVHRERGGLQGGEAQANALTNLTVST